jgi:hypothetical protein
MTVETFEARGQRLVQDQVAGVVVQAINEARIHDEIIKLAAQDAAFEQRSSRLTRFVTFFLALGIFWETRSRSTARSRNRLKLASGMLDRRSPRTQ